MRRPPARRPQIVRTGCCSAQHWSSRRRSGCGPRRGTRRARRAPARAGQTASGGRPASVFRVDSNLRPLGYEANVLRLAHPTLVRSIASEQGFRPQASQPVPVVHLCPDMSLLPVLLPPRVLGAAPPATLRDAAKPYSAAVSEPCLPSMRLTSSSALGGSS
jgi:hypothetical protein